MLEDLKEKKKKFLSFEIFWQVLIVTLYIFSIKNINKYYMTANK